MQKHCVQAFYFVSSKKEIIDIKDETSTVEKCDFELLMPRAQVRFPPPIKSR